MTTVFIVEDDFEAHRLANGLKALGVEMEWDEEGKVYRVEP